MEISEQTRNNLIEVVQFDIDDKDFDLDESRINPRGSKSKISKRS